MIKHFPFSSLSQAQRRKYLELHGRRILLRAEFFILPVLFPRHCPVCHKLVPYGSFSHPDCYKKLPFIHNPVCLRCGKPVSSFSQEYCYDCRIFPKSFQCGISLLLYNNRTRPLMNAFKYQNKRTIADFFTLELLQRYHSQMIDFQADAVIPVPIHKNKYKKRGYNQAALLSHKLALALNLPHYPDMLIRSIDTLPQKQFAAQARLNNLKKAFRFNTHYNSLISKNQIDSVLLVDDIYTTGSTMEACTRILHAAGISNVYIVSICTGIARE